MTERCPSGFVRTSKGMELKVHWNRLIFERNIVSVIFYGEFFLNVSYNLQKPVHEDTVFKLAEKICVALMERWPKHFALPVDQETGKSGVGFGMMPLPHDENLTQEFCIHVEIKSHNSLPMKQEVVEMIRFVERSHFQPETLVEV